MKILLSCYSFGAGKGSEPGVGWNVASGLARQGHEITVITTDEFTAINTPAIEKLGYPLEVLEWSCGLTQFDQASTYRRWQQLVAPQVRELTKNRSFDVIHHVNFNQYRHIKFIHNCQLPYLVGPVGGGETVPWSLMGELPCKLKLKEIARYLGLDAIPLGYRKAHSTNKGIYLTSSPLTQQRLKTWAHINSDLLPTIAINEEEIVQNVSDANSIPFFLAAGRIIPEKGMFLLIKALAHLWSSNIKIPLHLVGANSEQQYTLLSSIRHHHGLPPESITLLPMMPREELMLLMRKATAFVYPALRDSGSMAVLEALASGTRPVCFDLSSQSWIPDELAIKIPVRASTLITTDLAQGMQSALETPLTTQQHNTRVQFLTQHMTWESRLKQFEQYYKQLILM